MRRTLLDTSAYSAHMRGHDGIKQALQLAGDVFVSVVVLGELRAGFLNGSKARENEAMLQEFLAEPRVTTLDIDEETSARYAIIHADLRKRGTPVSVNDVWIAASAFQHGLRVLTTDGDFRHIPQVVVDYVDASA